jgi:hypothetical protein
VVVYHSIFANASAISFSVVIVYIFFDSHLALKKISEFIPINQVLYIKGAATATLYPKDLIRDQEDTDLLIKDFDVLSDRKNISVLEHIQIDDTYVRK